MQIQPYLFFNGRTEEALEFYREVLGAETLMKMRFKDAPSGPPGPKPPAEAIMHACVRIGDSQVMASDGMTCNNQPSFSGFSLSFQASDPADARRRFDALASGGEVQMPFGETFFAKAFGAVQDKFGVSWMIIAGPKQ